DLTRLLPGPFCTLYLAQLGAEVVKVEEPGGGDYARALSQEMFALGNRGKQSVTIDLKTSEGVAALQRLAAEAEVLIESFR
ncbi:CoA transferase, partial [Enterococcus faecium]